MMTAGQDQGLVQWFANELGESAPGSLRILERHPRIPLQEKRSQNLHLGNGQEPTRASVTN